MQTVQKYHVHDFTLNSDTEHDNPFAVTVNASLEHTSGARTELVGFYDGDGTWKVRFSPSLEGTWQGRTMSGDPALDGVSLEAIQCIPNLNEQVHGTVGIDRDQPQRLAWSDGTPLVALGFECDWLFSYHQADPERCYRHIDLIADRGFNYVMTNLYAHTGFTIRKRDDGQPIDPAYVFAPPAMYLFEGTNDEPDHGRMNVDFFRDFDALMQHMHGKGIVAHLMIQVQNKKVQWPARRSPEDERFWRYVVARYQAFGNLVWDISKEAYNLDRETGSHAYTVDRMDLIRRQDAYGHLVTAHDTARRSAGTLSEADAAADLYSDQIHLGEVDSYNREAIRCLRLLNKPYMNNEFGYELGVDDLLTYGPVPTTAPWQDMLKWTWAIYLAGAYPCYYYNNTSWDSIKFEPESPGWVRYRCLIDLLVSLPFNRMQADNELVARGMCLAELGKAYLVYLPDGGDVVVDLSAASGTVACEWMEILTGERREAETEADGFATEIANPFDDPSQPVVLAIRMA